MDKSTKRKKLFSVSISDCKVDTFTVGGRGGSGKDTSNTGVRVTHEASGAVGKASDTRSQSHNKQLAFVRMAETKDFQHWARLTAAKMQGQKSIGELVDEAMAPENIKVELRKDGVWIDESKDVPTA